MLRPVRELVMCTRGPATRRRGPGGVLGAKVCFDPEVTQMYGLLTQRAKHTYSTGPGYAVRNRRANRRQPKTRYRRNHQFRNPNPDF